MKKEHNFKNAERGIFAPTTSKAVRAKGLKRLRPRTMKIGFEVTQEVIDALRTLKDTGLFGNGRDVASVAEELLRRALLDPSVVPYWKTTRESP